MDCCLFHLSAYGHLPAPVIPSPLGRDATTRLKLLIRDEPCGFGNGIADSASQPDIS